jgi:hypothetical protein
MTKSIILAMALLAPIPAQAGSPPKIMYPEFYDFQWRNNQCHFPPYFECDFTSKTCLKGYGSARGAFAGVVLAEDRQTVLAHVVHFGDRWFNVDTGEIQWAGGTLSKEQAADFFRISPKLQEMARERDTRRQQCRQPEPEPPPE